MSRVVPSPIVPKFVAPLGDPLTQARKMLVEIFDDTATWEAIDESRVPTKNQWGPRAIYYGGWFPTCSERSHICVNDLSKDKRGAVCVYDCSGVEPKSGRFSAEDADKWIKVKPYRTTNKVYHPNITDTILKATNLEQQYLDQAETDSKPTYTFQVQQGPQFIKIDHSTEDNVIHQPEFILKSVSWLPSSEFTNDGQSLEGFPLFTEGAPYELIWSWKDNTQPQDGKEDTFYEVIQFNVSDRAVLGVNELVFSLVSAALLLQMTF